MFWVFLALAFVSFVIAWVLEALSVLRRWSDEHSVSELVLDIEIEMVPAKHRDEFDSGTLGLVFAIVLLVLLFVPSAVNSNGQSISLLEISDSMMQASMDAGTVNTFVSEWRAVYPLKFWAFFVGLPLTVIWLFRRSPVWLGVAVVAALLVFWLKIIAGVSTLSF